MHSNLAKSVVNIIILTIFTMTPSTLFAIETPILTASISGLDVSLSWTPITGAKGYSLHYAPYPYFSEQAIGKIDMGKNTSFSATLWDGANFYVAITATDGSIFGDSGYSNIWLIQCTDSDQVSIDVSRYANMDGLWEYNRNDNGNLIWSNIEVIGTDFINGEKVFIAQHYKDYQGLDTINDREYFSADMSEGLFLIADWNRHDNKTTTYDRIPFLLSKFVLGEIYSYDINTSDGDSFVVSISIEHDNVSVPYGTFEDCYKSTITIGDEVITKWFVKDVGLVKIQEQEGNAFDISLLVNYTQKKDVIGSWHMVGICSSSYDTGTFVFSNDNTFVGKMTDENANTWDESGTYTIQGNKVYMDFGNGSWNLTLTSSSQMTGIDGDCSDTLIKVK